MQRVFFLNAFLILVIVSSSVFTQSDRRLIQRRRDAINNWIRRIRSSKRGYSLSPSWNGKSPYQVPSVANLPLQSEPEDNNIRNTLPVRRFKRKRVQDTVIAPKFPPNYDELNFDGFDQALELTDFEGNPLKTADFHPDVDDESPPSHKDPYASFDTGFLGDFKEEYQFPTAPPATEKPTESPPLAKYPYRNHQEIVLSEELNKVPRRPIYNSPITSTNSNNNDFKPSYPYKNTITKSIAILIHRTHSMTSLAQLHHRGTTTDINQVLTTEPL
ncbi:unnamed protein product [Lepeophtheirus salmonis]|uniref:(salmon louse) hypothetical protein n=1 Tax=Lepeophtheirus salmonis TaxID=72036 RepID=A0A7R8CPE5_LEPSM|nr:unnamed protein product [Lepeophtheirus salmonis]CAF2885613.1 unnamed protein product [Lepeophtheirus salmonis]